MSGNMLIMDREFRKAENMIKSKNFFLVQIQDFITSLRYLQRLCNEAKHSIGLLVNKDGLNLLHLIIQNKFPSYLEYLVKVGVFTELDIPISDEKSNFFQLDCIKLAVELKKSDDFVAEIEACRQWEKSLSAFHRKLRLPSTNVTLDNITRTDILNTDIKGYNCFHWAAIGGNPHMIQRMRDIQIDWKSYLTANLKSSIELAAEMGNNTVVKTLLIDYTGTCDEERVFQKLLQTFAENGDIEMTKMIITTSANQLELSRGSLLNKAVTANRPEYVKMLLTQYNSDPNVNHETDDKSTRGCMLRSACCNNFEGVVRVLLSHPQCDMTLTNYRQRNCLHWAVESGSLSLVSLIIETANLRNIKSTLINKHDLFYRDELHYLVRGKDNGEPAWFYVEVKRKHLREFLEKLSGSTLHIANYGKIIKSGWGNDPDDQTEKMLEELGEVFIDSEKDCTPLLVAMNSRHYEIAKLLLHYGCDINAQDYFGLSALHYAAMNSSKEMCAYLITNGVDITLKDSDGKIAKDLIEPTETELLTYFGDLEAGKLTREK